MKTIAILFIALLILVIFKVVSMFLRHNHSSKVLLVFNDQVYSNQYNSPIYVGANGYSISDSTYTCFHYYGFFPCADNIGGYVFQILIYQYLLFKGEKFLTKGSKWLFNIFGIGFFGATIFRILMVVPEIIVVLSARLTSNKEEAQSKVVMGVGMLTGTSVFCLTIQWGACVIFGRTELYQKPAVLQDSQTSSTSKPLLYKEKLPLFTGYGITIDKRTSYTARIMLQSLLPFVIVLFANIFNSSSWSRLVILVALIASVSSLFAYFAYQIYNPWIQERSLEYTKYENLLVGFLEHVHRRVNGKLVTEDGTPNIPVIKRLFYQMDQDLDNCIKLSELQALMMDLQSKKGIDLHRDEMLKQITELFSAFDTNKDDLITEEEFVKGFKIAIGKAKQLVAEGDSKSKESLFQVVQPWIKKRQQELIKIERLMSKILKHCHSQILESEDLLEHDGRPNLDSVESLFKQFDKNNDGKISSSELKELIGQIKFGKIELDHDEVVEIVIKDFDEDGDDMIDEREFANGIKKWLAEAMRVANFKDGKRSIDEFDQITWKEVDSLVYEVEEKGSNFGKIISWDFMKAMSLVILGIAIVTFLAEPLIDDVSNLSIAISVPSFFTSFVVIPLTLNARVALSSIFTASQKNSKISSVTFSEIYGGVVMKNIMTLSTILAVVYIKDLAWDYSIEVLVVLVVCCVIGLLAFLSSTYPLWTCILAFLLYPFSLVLVYVLHYVWGWN